MSSVIWRPGIESVTTIKNIAFAFHAMATDQYAVHTVFKHGLIRKPPNFTLLFLHLFLPLSIIIFVFLVVVVMVVAVVIIIMVHNLFLIISNLHKF